MKLIDTNILLDNPLILEELDDIVLSIRVLEEIDGLKKNINPEVSFNARRASHFIDKNSNKLKFYTKTHRKMSVDNELIHIAKKNGYQLLTNDINVQIKCKMKKVEYSGVKKKEIDYTGTRYYIAEFDDNGYNAEIENIINSKIPPSEMCENEFLIIKDKNRTITLKNGDIDYETYCILQYKNNELSVFQTRGIKNQYLNYIKPRNPEQECLLKILNDKDISIVLAAGTFGVGKSFLLINYALQELEKGRIDKIVYVPNNSFNDNSREIGALPGDLLEKELIHMGTLVDIVGAINVEEMVRRGAVEIVPVSVMRGRSFNNSIIIVNEAQNLTEDHIKLLIARCGDGTRIFFDGDVKQADNQVFRNKNGLKLLSNLKKSPVFSKIFGTVKLKNIERSLTARASAYLDEI